MSPLVSDDLDDLSVDELMKRLEQLGLQTTGSKAVLRERLRRAVEGEMSQTADSRDGHGRIKNETGNADAEIELETLSKDQLKQSLRNLNLLVSGLKAVLRERLRAALQRDSSDKDGDENESDEDKDETTHDSYIQGNDGAKGVRATPFSGRGARTGLIYENNDGRRSGQGSGQHLILAYKDVEDALLTFSGDGTQNVKTWFTSFEETAELTMQMVRGTENYLCQEIITWFRQTVRKF